MTGALSSRGGVVEVGIIVGNVVGKVETGVGCWE
jgi:hypothetical protein